MEGVRLQATRLGVCEAQWQLIAVRQRCGLRRQVAARTSCKDAGSVFGLYFIVIAA